MHEHHIEVEINVTYVEPLARYVQTVTPRKCLLLPRERRWISGERKLGGEGISRMRQVSKW